MSIHAHGADSKPAELAALQFIEASGTDACTELSDHSHGADTIQFFQLRRSKGGCEKFHGAVIAHVGTNDTRVFKETAQLGGELEASAQGHLAHAISQMWESSLTGTITGHLSTQADLHRTLNMLTRFTTIMSIFTTKISLLI